MVTYTKDEMLTATEVVRKFSTVLNDVCETDKKVVIMKNNKLEAVLLSIKEYEKMYEAMQILKELYSKKDDLKEFLKK
ncbi:MAG: Unknown protein [uncultured Campylobacterales bacterium]|uniref:Antitoxin n=1 Tax=uncultured Campylobacterales bacterium TaxID=352960 RepID=A0A6S6SM18_9BACT|nr:MAG: Unknown protein [uncultured Campylobacterales bacterium]